MNLQVTEPILDQLAAIIGIFMFLVAVYVFIKLLTQPRQAKQDLVEERNEQPISSEEKKAPIPKAQLQPELVMAKSFALAGSSSQDHAPAPRPRPVQTKQPPQLAFSKISRSGSNLIRLTLTNVGTDMRFEQVRPDKFNEIDVSFQSKAMIGGAYKSKSSMNFLLKGQNLDFATYHFKVFYRDQKGRRYVQEIAGLGDEVPIVEPPILSKS